MISTSNIFLVSFFGESEVPLDWSTYDLPPFLLLETTQVPLNAPVPVSERVEEWLEHLNVEMKGTLTSLLQECLRGQIDYERYPSQVLT